LVDVIRGWRAKISFSPLLFHVITFFYQNHQRKVICLEMLADLARLAEMRKKRFFRRFSEAKEA
jgi:hypothetical protein